MRPLLSSLLIFCLTGVPFSLAEVESGDGSGKKYKPEWSDLDSRPLPQWYDEAKVGIFMHFGPYAVPGKRRKYVELTLY